MRKLVLALALVVAPQVAHAGLVLKNSDIFQLTPFVGYEVTRFGFAAIDPQKGLTGDSFVASGLTYGALAGAKIGPLSFGLLFQRTEDYNLPSSLDSLNLNKLYGELGVNIRAGRLALVWHFDFGWAFFQPNGGPLQEGFGGKMGLALDFYPIRAISIGGNADLDLQGFSTNNGLIGGFGGTFVFRVGLHI